MRYESVKDKGLYCRVIYDNKNDELMSLITICDLLNSLYFKEEDDERYIRMLEKRNAELTKERDEYDKRRREAIEKTTEYMKKYFDLIKKI